MTKLATLLLSTALAGGLTLSAVVPSSAATENVRHQTHNYPAQQAQGQGQQMQGMDQQMQGMQGMQGMRGGEMGLQGLGRDEIIRFACSVNGAPRLEIALNNLSERLTLNAEQTTLFDALKTSALSAQTTFADTCDVPAANAATPLNPVERLKLFETNETARLAAINSILPAFEAFYNGLSDVQKAELDQDPRGGDQVGQGFGPGMHGNHRGGGQDNMGPGNMGPGNMNQNQGDFAPGNGPGNDQGNGQGFGPGKGKLIVPNTNN